MDKPRIFLGSSGQQKKLLQALTRGLDDVAHVEPWTTSFNPGTTTLVRLFELAHEVDFAAFDGALELRGRAWNEDGSLSARYWSEAVKERKEPSGVFYYWKGERPRDPEKSCSSPPIAGPGISRLVRTRARTRGRPVFTVAPIRRTWASWTETTIGDARS
jgi:hypothetical protein